MGVCLMNPEKARKELEERLKDTAIHHVKIMPDNHQGIIWLSACCRQKIIVHEIQHVPISLVAGQLRKDASEVLNEKKYLRQS